MTNERIKEIAKIGGELERKVTEYLGIQENTITCDTLKDQGVTERMLKQFDTKPVYIGEQKDKMSYPKGIKKYTYMGFRVFDDPVIKLYFILKLVYAGYPEEYSVPEQEFLFEIPSKLKDCGTQGSYIGGKGMTYVHKFDLEDLEKYIKEIQNNIENIVCVAN
ncbi:hypothetical protein ACFHWD_03735 [Clostridium sp. MT-14]|uniref:hypothetical protein n=1 Tax=Clostridium sp. MT-14 TaxID=3348360 RepID=UPI0035F354B2